MFERSIQIINETIHSKRIQIEANNIQALDNRSLAEYFRRVNSDLEFDIQELLIAITALKDRRSNG